MPVSESMSKIVWNVGFGELGVARSKKGLKCCNGIAIESELLQELLPGM